MHERPSAKRPRLFLLAPVPVRVDERRREPPLPQASCREMVLGWLRYHATQMRWDIERRLARLLRRPWINPRR